MCLVCTRKFFLLEIAIFHSSWYFALTYDRLSPSLFIYPNFISLSVNNWCVWVYMWRSYLLCSVCNRIERLNCFVLLLFCMCRFLWCYICVQFIMNWYPIFICEWLSIFFIYEKKTKSFLWSCTFENDFNWTLKCSNKFLLFSWSNAIK